jgi:hypothetical protein
VAKSEQFIHRKETAVCQRNVERGAGVALGEEQPVPLGPVWTRRIDLQMVKIERGKYFGDRECTANVASLRAVDHHECVDAERLRFER